jgi:hypothetical protein
LRPFWFPFRCLLASFPRSLASLWQPFGSILVASGLKFQWYFDRILNQNGSLNVVLTLLLTL